VLTASDMDYINVICHVPLYTWHFLCTAWWMLSSLPYPSLAEIFGSIVIFIILYPIRSFIQVVIPAEKLVPRRVYKRQKKLVPTPTDHHSATAAASGLIHHL
jgi:hypothetical protein